MINMTCSFQKNVPQHILQWYFKKEELRDLTPSRKDNISEKEELDLRKKSCAFIQELGMKLKLPQLTIATAIVFFHRFYMRGSFKTFDATDLGAACLFLAGKVEETPKKIRDFVAFVHYIKTKATEPLEEKSKEFWDIKEAVLTNERILLQTLCFDLMLEHPYVFILNYNKVLKGEKSLAQAAWNFVNDSLRTTLCLQYSPQKIAAAAIYLAARFQKVQLSYNYELNDATTNKLGPPKLWFEYFNISKKDIEDISNQILDLYDLNSIQSVQPGSSPPTISKIEQKKEKDETSQRVQEKADLERSKSEFITAKTNEKIGNRLADEHALLELKSSDNPDYFHIHKTEITESHVYDKVMVTQNTEVKTGDIKSTKIEQDEHSRSAYR